MVELIEITTAYASLEKLVAGFQPACSPIEVTNSSRGRQGLGVVCASAPRAGVPETLLLPPVIPARAPQNATIT